MALGARLWCEAFPVPTDEHTASQTHDTYRSLTASSCRLLTPSPHLAASPVSSEWAILSGVPQSLTSRLPETRSEEGSLVLTLLFLPSGWEVIISLPDRSTVVLQRNPLSVMYRRLHVGVFSSGSLTGGAEGGGAEGGGANGGGANGGVAEGRGQRGGADDRAGGPGPTEGHGRRRGVALRLPPGDRVPQEAFTSSPP
ncbi:unnamed protein product [Arctogadus glacialis]